MYSNLPCQTFHGLTNGQVDQGHVKLRCFVAFRSCVVQRARKCRSLRHETTQGPPADDRPKNQLEFHQQPLFFGLTVPLFPMLALATLRTSPREIRFPVTHKKMAGRAIILMTRNPNKSAFTVLKYNVMPEPSVFRSFIDVFHTGAIASPYISFFALRSACHEEGSESRQKPSKAHFADEQHQLGAM
jgi:hypothetical protein